MSEVVAIEPNVEPVVALVDVLDIERPNPPNPVQLGQIYLPMWYTPDLPLHLVVYETFGKPIRYFDNLQAIALEHFRNSVDRNVLVKTLARKVVVGESYSFNVSYSITPVRDSYWLTRPAGSSIHRSFPIVQMESILRAGIPEELRSALLLVAEAELA